MDPTPKWGFYNPAEGTQIQTKKALVLYYLENEINTPNPRGVSPDILLERDCCLEAAGRSPEIFILRKWKPN